MKYEDEHRIFVQGIMCKGILSSQEVGTLFKVASERCGRKVYDLSALDIQVFELYETMFQMRHFILVVVPDDPASSNQQLVAFIKCINEELKDINFEIVKVLDEDFERKMTYYAFVNRMDRSNDSTQLTRKVMVRYAQHELEYFKLIVEAVMDNEEREIGNIDAINLAKNVKTKMVRNQEGEGIICKFVDDLWLKKTKDGVIRLAPRFLAEMEPYLKEMHGDEIKHCQLCKKMIVRGLSCQFCPPGTVTYHRYCLASKKAKKEDTAAACQQCQKKIEFVQNESTSEKRKRRIVESDSD